MSISLIIISQIIQSYLSPLKSYMPVFKTLMQLKLKILTSLIIRNVIITIIKIGIRVYTHSLIKRLISKIYNYGLYRGTIYYKQQLYPLYNWPSVIFIILQLVTIGKFRQALAPPPLQININKEVTTSKLYFITVLSTTLHNIVISNSKPLLLV